MHLRAKLVLTATALTFAIVLVLSTLFLGELLRQRFVQTSESTGVLAHEVLLVTRQAIETGLRAHPPQAVAPGGATSASDAEASLHAAVTDALRSSAALADVMNAIVRYSPTVQDVSVTDPSGVALVSTDEDAVGRPIGDRTSFAEARDGGIHEQMREVFGRPHLLDVSAPLDRNGVPFLIVHVGVRSTFLRNAYEPWLRAALWLTLAAVLASVAASALLSTVALRPLRTIGEQLERLTLGRGDANPDAPALLLDASPRRIDPIGRVNLNIDRLDRQMRSREEGYSALQANMNQMLDTLRDGVLLFTADRRAVMVSDAVVRFLVSQDDGSREPSVDAMIGMQLEEIFAPETALGAAVLAAFESGRHASVENVALEDGRQVQLSFDRIQDTRGDGNGSSAGVGSARDMGTLVTLRDTASALELEQELEVSRRLAAIGRLTANVGHEVKNPINAMVVHLELLRAKLAGGGLEQAGAERHVEILADEMHRLDRVVQTLADFSRPMELDLREHDLRHVIGQVLELAGVELKEQSIVVESELPAQPMLARIDAELIRQALLNLVLNAMQAMPGGGRLRVALRREPRLAAIEIADNGAGIPDAVLPRIFDLYFTTKPTGSGIGLAMTYRILQLHGGAMDVRSNISAESLERGTVFTLRIPISTAVGDVRRPISRLAGPEAVVAEAANAGAFNIEAEEID